MAHHFKHIVHLKGELGSLVEKAKVSV